MYYLAYVYNYVLLGVASRPTLSIHYHLRIFSILFIITVDILMKIITFFIFPPEVSFCVYM